MERRGARYEGGKGENARSKSQVKGVSRKADARRINPPRRYERRFFRWPLSKTLRPVAHAPDEGARLLHNARTASGVIFDNRSRIPTRGFTAKINWHSSSE
jgi:hypothetical protein